MRLRTKLFVSWSSIILLLCACIFWPVQSTISQSLNKMTAANFAGTRQTLQSLRVQQIDRMRQAGKMLMDIPELRALIAEENFEISQENRESLEERLNSLSDMVNVGFICVLDARGSLIAQNAASPWPNLAELNRYLTSPQASSLVKGLYTKSVNNDGLWVYQGHLYEVVGLPLVFNESGKNQSQPTDGALIMAARVTNKMAEDLAASHNCQVTFIANDTPIASSLSSNLDKELLAEYHQNHWPLSTPFDATLAGIDYRSYLEPLTDRGSGKTIGVMLIQSSLLEGDLARTKILHSLLADVSAALFAAAIISYLISGAITRPVNKLVQAVRRVGGGDLDTFIRIQRGNELGELARAFNDMLAKLRAQRDLQRQVEASRAASKAKSQFLANMSHEIRTPLHGVIGMANLLLRTELSDRQRRYANLVKSSSEVLTTLINDILDFSKIEAGKLELESVDFKVHDIVEDVVELLAQKAIEKNVEIACHVSSGVPATLRGDPNRLRQILMNLIGNAVKFTERGEILVRVSQTAAETGGVLVRFDVSDTGIGIPAQRIDKLFKSFSQVDASTTRRYGGTGLGLAISKQLAELMGGGIGAHSEIGKGSTFWFTVNLTAVDSAQDAPPKELAGVGVLIVDDDNGTRRTLQQHLTEAGMVVSVAATREDAMTALSKPVPVVIVDQRILGFDSTPLARTIAEQYPQTKLLLLTTSQDEPTPAELASTGYSRALLKPVRKSLLIQTISVVLGYTALESTAALPAALEKASRRLRILLAEDNEINRMVACDFLSQAGYECDVVVDGEKAVKAVMETDYDLTLMDCQMPEMDGLEATKAIRRHEQQQIAAGQPRRRMPIIALTANASGADRARCMEAGMDDYCGKPFQPEKLLKTIASFLANSSPVARADSAPSPMSGKPPFQVASLLERCTGNPKLASAVLEKFEKQTRDAIAELQECLKQGDGEALARISHAIKGTAGIVAAEQLHLSAGQLEQFGRDNQLELAQKSLEAFRAEVERCSEYMATARSQLQQSVKT